jgi:hypothetical protein
LDFTAAITVERFSFETVSIISIKRVFSEHHVMAITVDTLKCDQYFQSVCGEYQIQKIQIKASSQVRRRAGIVKGLGQVVSEIVRRAAANKGRAAFPGPIEPGQPVRYE